eukprot:2977744-Pyramimonas_sp.AAC.1
MGSSAVSRLTVDWSRTLLALLCLPLESFLSVCVELLIPFVLAVGWEELAVRDHLLRHPFHLPTDLLPECPRH